MTESLNNQINLEMIYIPKGKYWMGTTNDEIERLCHKFNSDEFKRESPIHQVEVTSFLISKYPITQAQWEKIALRKDLKCEIDLPINPSYFQGNNSKENQYLPVENINWHQAQEFCQRLSKLTNRQYQLPTEVEWEYACKGSKNDNPDMVDIPFHYGETIAFSLANYQATTVYEEEIKGKYRNQTTPVNSFKPNGFWFI